MLTLSHRSIANLNIRGPIPTDLGRLTSLEVLELSYNILIGSVPNSLFALKHLDLRSNLLSGEVAVCQHPKTFTVTDRLGSIECMCCNICCGDGKCCDVTTLECSVI